MATFSKPVAWLLLLLIPGVVGGWWWSREPVAPHPPWESLLLGLPMQPSSALVIVALEEGLFEAQRLRVTVKEYPSGKRALGEGLLRGEVELVTVSDVPIVFATLEGKPLRIVATLFQAGNVNRIVARRDQGIDSPADLAGKRVATQARSAVHFFLHQFLLEHGLDEGRISLSFLSAEALPGALDAGGIDAFSMREPFIGQAMALLGEKGVVFAAPRIYEQMESLVVAPGTAATRSQALRRVVGALLEAEGLARREPERVAGLVARRLGADRALVAEALSGSRLRVALGQGLVLLLEDEARWAMDQGLHPPGRVPDFAALIVPGILEAIAPERVSCLR